LKEKKRRRKNPSKRRSNTGPFSHDRIRVCISWHQLEGKGKREKNTGTKHHIRDKTSVIRSMDSFSYGKEKREKGWGGGKE